MARAKRGRKSGAYEDASVESTWWSSEGGGPPLTELIAETQGPLSPWGEDHTLPLPPERVGYVPPTGRPNRAGAN
ncbi:MAG: hypothetical protein M3313_01525 [Actinomycetota bacterium]|nr:hypothetical protein [Actinomycetota bacterium]